MFLPTFRLAYPFHCIATAGQHVYCVNHNRILCVVAERERLNRCSRMRVFLFYVRKPLMDSVRVFAVTQLHFSFCLVTFATLLCACARSN